MSRHALSHFVNRIGLTVGLSLLVTVVNYSLPARGSAAAPLKATEITVTDPATDATPVLVPGVARAAHFPELDLVSADIVQDRPSSQVHATVTLAGPSTGVAAILRVALGYGQLDGRCLTQDYRGQPDAAVDPAIPYAGAVHLETMIDDEPIPGPPAAPTPVPGFYIIGSPLLLNGALAKTSANGTISLTTPVSPYFAQRGWDCALVSVELRDGTGRRQVVDEATGIAPKEVTTTEAAPPPIGNATAQAPDADGDGVPDVSDVCPQLAGAATNGCASTPLSRSVVLGTKRVVFDRLIPRTGTSCPAAVKATAVLKGRVVGTGKIGVPPRSKWCQVRGVLKLKKNVRKTRVTVKGAGMAPFAITVSK